MHIRKRARNRAGISRRASGQADPGSRGRRADWQLHRALSGNELSWAYTFEWPLFTIFGIYFWAKTLRDEVRGGQQTQNSQQTQKQTQNNHQTGIGADASSEPSTADAYVARLKAEVQGHGRWHGWR